MCAVLWSITSFQVGAHILRSCLIALGEWSSLPRLSIRIYLTAAFLSNAPAMSLVFFLTFLERTFLVNHFLLLQIVFFLVMFAGAALAGYLVVRRFRTQPPALGLATGSLSYVINLVYTIFLYREYMVLSSYWPFLAFVFGGVVGAQLSGMFQKRHSHRP